MGSAPYLGGGFGHFYHYAPEKWQYPIDRFTMEVKRQMDVLDKQLGENEFVAGGDYSIADMAIWPWYGNLVLGRQYGDAATFLDADSYTNLKAWAERLDAREPVKRGRMVNRTAGEPHEQLHERHDASDFETKTQDKIGEN
jgi:GST-like protein